MFNYRIFVECVVDGVAHEIVREWNSPVQLKQGEWIESDCIGRFQIEKVVWHVPCVSDKQAVKTLASAVVELLPNNGIYNIEKHARLISEFGRLCKKNT